MNFASKAPTVKHNISRTAKGVAGGYSPIVPFRMERAAPAATPRPAHDGRDDVAADAERHVRLCGLDICDMTLDAAADWIIDRAQAGAATKVGFINAHCVNVLTGDDAYWQALRGFDRLFADGSGMRFAAKIGGVGLKDNVNGTDLFPLLCRKAASSETRIFLFGGRPGIAEAAAQKMADQFAGLPIAGTHHGYVTTAAEESALIAAINASGAQILLVGLGVPFQETWIARNRDRITVPCIVGVGGLFDYYSGRIPRAPLALRMAGVEWIWRLAMEPRRLANRYLVGNLVFLARILAWRFASPRSFCTTGATFG